MHHHDVGLCGGKPSDELVLARDVHTQESAVAFVVSVIGDTAALCGQSADHIDICVPAADEAVIQQGAPASLCWGEWLMHRNRCM